MLTLIFLAMAQAPTPMQAGGTGIFSNGYEVPGTVYFTNNGSGSQRVPLMLVNPQVGWKGVDANGSYWLTTAGVRDPMTGTYTVTQWFIGITTGDNSGTLSLKIGKAPPWSLESAFMTVTPN